VGLHAESLVNGFVNGTLQWPAKSDHKGPQIAVSESLSDLRKPISTTPRHTNRGSLGVKRSRVQVPAARLKNVHRSPPSGSPKSVDRLLGRHAGVTGA
jgi:hypothetical protein